MSPSPSTTFVALIGDDEHYSEAEGLARRSLTIREEALGKLHPLVASSLNNLAVVLDSTGRPKDAEPLLKRALEIRLSALGDAHPDVANSFNNLGAHYLDSKDWQQAYDAFVRASARCRPRSAETGEGQTRSQGLWRHKSIPGSIVAAYQLARRPTAEKRPRCDPARSRPRNGPATNSGKGDCRNVGAGCGGQRRSAGARSRAAGPWRAGVAVDRLQLIALMSQSNAARNPQTEQALRTRHPILRTGSVN